MAPLVLAFITGIALSALFGNILELKTRQIARLGEPFVSTDNIPLSLIFMILAGPYFLVSEGLRAGMGDVADQRVIHMIVIVFASLWALASGILWLELFVLVAQVL